MKEIDQGTRRDHRGQCERPGNASGQSTRLSPSPLAPPFGQAPIGDSAERQIIQVSPQVIRQGSCVAITLGRLRCQAFQSDVGQPDADLGVAAVAELAGHVPAPRTSAAESFAQQEPQCIKIRAVVHGCRDWLPQAHGLECGFLFGCHPARCSAQSVRDPLAGLDRLAREMEVKQHRLSITRDQDVRRLHVHVNQAMNVSLVQAVGQAGRDPADRMDIRRLIKIFVIRAVAGRGRRRAPSLDLVEHIEEVTPPALVVGDLGQRLQNPRQARPTKVRHAQCSQASIRERLLREQGDDVRVLQPGQREVFLLVVGNDFQNDKPIGQRRLGGQVRLA